MSRFADALRPFRARPDRRPSRWVLVGYDQLAPAHPLLTGDAADTGVIYLETSAKPARRPYHAQKLVLLLAAMRHDALARGRAGHPVIYHASDQWYDHALESVRAQHRLDVVETLAPAEAEVRAAIARRPWVRQHPNSLFITDTAFYRRVFGRMRSRRLETFYRAARRATGLLMDGDQPAGGRWNLDADNRRTWRGSPPVPPRPVFAPDAITAEVIALVRERYPRSFGAIDGFAWPVTADQAARAADQFFAERLAAFGPFEDAMADAEPVLFHSLLSASINLGHLDPLALCRRADAAWRRGEVPLASAEGFIRQILGWREFVRHVFDESAARYAGGPNALEAHLPLPAWYWGEPSGLRCVDRTVQTVIATGHSHHITRLMVLANLATLLGVDPQALNQWFWFAYVDAYEWVVTPNVVGMGTYADGGLVASKPYVASGKYLQRMGPSQCAACQYDAAASTGPNACPFTHLYWDFLARHQARLAGNPRMAIPLAAVRRLPAPVLEEHRREAQRWRTAAAAAGAPEPAGDSDAHDR
jgi:deoxyribodipyrimidine photolyase-related protein